MSDDLDLAAARKEAEQAHRRVHDWPSKVLALLDRLEKAEAERDRLADTMEQLGEDVIEIEGAGISPWSVDLTLNYSGNCVAEKLRRIRALASPAGSKAQAVIAAARTYRQNRISTHDREQSWKAEAELCDAVDALDGAPAPTGKEE